MFGLSSSSLAWAAGYILAIAGAVSSTEYTWALWGTLAATAAVALHFIFNRQVNFVLRVTLAVCTFVFGAIAWVKISHSQEEARRSASVGVLLPGADPFRENDCTRATSGGRDLDLFLGGATATSDHLPQTVIRIFDPKDQEKSKTVLSFNRDTGGKLLFSARFFNPDGNIAAEIIDNKYEVFSQYVSKFTLPDSSELIIFDRKLQKLLDVRFLNDHQISLVGNIFLDGGLATTATAEDFRVGHVHLPVCLGPARRAQIAVRVDLPSDSWNE